MIGLYYSIVKYITTAVTYSRNDIQSKYLPASIERLNMISKLIYKNNTNIYMFETNDNQLKTNYEQLMLQKDEARNTQIKECAHELHYNKNGLETALIQRADVEEKYRSYTIIGRLLHYRSYQNQMTQYDNDIKYYQPLVNHWRKELWDKIHKTEDMNDLKQQIYALLDNHHYRKLTEKTKSGDIVTEYWVKKSRWRV